MAIFWWLAFEIVARLHRIEGELEHAFPVKVFAAAAHFIVPVACARDALGHVGSMGGDAAGDDAIAHVLQIWQTQMLSRGDIAEEIGAVGGCDGPTDGRGDVVVARRDVGDQWPEHVEWCAVAEAFFQLHVGLYLV